MSPQQIRDQVDRFAFGAIKWARQFREREEFTEYEERAIMAMCEIARLSFVQPYLQRHNIDPESLPPSCLEG